ncbi:MAG: hypothetical protein ACM3VT_11115 [Solirubrobacterales bacterium]
MTASTFILCFALWSISVTPVNPSVESAVFNGSFDQDANADNVPDGWAACGRPDIDQQLSAVADPQRGAIAKLDCRRFAPGFPDSHAMLAQLDHMGVKSGQWYRLRLWARAENLASGAAQIALVNRKQWANVGLSDSFAPDLTWRRFEFSFRAQQDLAAQDSRFQIWFAGTGSLYVDDISLEPIAELRRQWYPQLPTEGVVNAIPNSGFECGGSGWGCWGGGIPGWGGQVFSLLGQWDDSHAYEGRHSWRLSLSPDTLPVCYFDYFDPIAAPVRILLIGHEGWVPLERGRRYVFSAYVAADREETRVRVICQLTNGSRIHKEFTVGRAWTRVTLSFIAETDFACGFVGLDLLSEHQREGTLWIDAVQWEPGEEPSAYASRDPLEARVETDRIGNIFTDPEKGMAFRLRTFNAADENRTLKGVLTLTDYVDQVVWRQELENSVAAKDAAQIEYDHVLPGRCGFYRLRWQPESGLAQTLRCAVIEPSTERDSLFGMNHAFSWEFLLRLSHDAGIRWWRDWSVKWHTVQPEPGAFFFNVPDPQIKRVLDVQGRVLVLLPFPSATWATKPDMEKVKAQAEGDEYLLQRLVVAHKPERLEDFAGYVRAAVEHYGKRINSFEILNEPLYTTYAVPAAFGHTTADYIALLRTAWETAKAVDPSCTIIGGVAAPPDSRWVNDFLDQGGLQWCDAMNLHLYPHRGAPDAYEEAFRVCWERVTSKGPKRPIWVTEIGLYGDDDPPFTPFTVGDDSMNNALRPSELRTAGDLVKFATILCAAGVQKVFYHAGTCDALNQNNAGNIFFEYGGAPRKQYAAQAALARLLGPDVEFVRKWTQIEGIQAFEFRSRGRSVVVLWSGRSIGSPLKVPAGYRVLDLMGNPLPAGEVTVNDVPVYWVQVPEN